MCTGAERATSTTSAAKARRPSRPTTRPCAPSYRIPKPYHTESEQRVGMASRRCGRCRCARLNLPAQWGSTVAAIALANRIPALAELRALSSSWWPHVPGCSREPFHHRSVAGALAVSTLHRDDRCPLPCRCNVCSRHFMGRIGLPMSGLRRQISRLRCNRSAEVVNRVNLARS
jgi:hypothetical protein